MTIEFHCPFCQKLLKTPDDKAGVRANCPGCGEMVTVPSAAHEAAHADPSLEEIKPVAGPQAGRDELAIDEDGEGAAADHLAGGTKPCPMCGAEIKQAARRCRFCGETLVEPQQIDVNFILMRTWEIYKKQLGILIAAQLIVGGIGAAVSFAGNMVQQVLMFAVGRGGGGGGNNAAVASAMILLSLFFTAITIAVTAFMQAGFHILLLRVARGENAEIGELFSGSRYFWRYFWGTLLFQIMLVLAYLLLIIPGILLSLMFWPVFYVVVDRDVGIIDSFQRATEVTSGNYMLIFILFLVGVGVQILGVFPGFCIGLLFTMPFWAILWAITYCEISRPVAVKS